MFPDAYHQPTVVSQQFIRLGVSVSVCPRLLGPVLGIRLDLDVMGGAPMPEASVKEDGDTKTRKEQISRPTDRLQGSPIYEIPHAQCVNSPPKRELGLGVPAFVCLHARSHTKRGRPGLA
jgi:hypothetical protein